MLDTTQEVSVKFSFNRMASQIGPMIKPCFESLVSYTASEIRNDLFFYEHIVYPAFLSTIKKVECGIGTLSLTKEQFSQLFYYLREELVVTYMNAVILVDDFHTKFIKALGEGLRKMKP